MSGDVFVDTNVLVYHRDASETTKQPLATAWLDHLWQSGTGRLSVQVLSEYYVTVTRKLNPGLPKDDARADIADYGVWRPAPLTSNLLEMAFGIEGRFGVSWWDALIVAAAQSLDCAILLSEDLQDGMDFYGVVVKNPFRHPPSTRSSSSSASTTRE